MSIPTIVYESNSWASTEYLYPVSDENTVMDVPLPDTDALDISKAKTHTNWRFQWRRSTGFDPAKEAPFRPRQTPNVDLPATTLDKINAAFEEAREILEWGDDWDEEGSPGYSVITWMRARDFLVSNARHLWQSMGHIVPAPKVLPGPEGSIDLHWQTNDHELLVNVPADTNKPIEFYGDTAAHTIIKGSITPATGNQWLLMWLTE